MSYKTTITSKEVSKTIEPSDFYLDTEFVAPDGYEFTGEFRNAEIGEFFLPGPQKSDSVIESNSTNTAKHWGPRLILRKIPKEKNYKFTYVRTGFPQIGEYFLWTSYLNPQCFSRASSDFIDGEQYKIYTLTEEEA